MGRKIKSILLLILLLVLIYYQHSPVIHAEDSENANEETNEDGDDQDKESEKEEENENGEDDEEPVEEYHLEISESNGNNGYYITMPKVKIEHVSKRGATVYSLRKGETIIEEGRLSDEDSLVVFDEGQFTDGYHVLSVHMEDEEGERIEEYEQVKEFMIDTKPPVFEMNVPEGFDAWYQRETYLYVSAADQGYGSGIDTISCYCENKHIDTVEGSEGTFLINHASWNGSGAEITVVVSDKAGHQTADTKRVYIDNSAPKIEIGGITDYMITSYEVPVLYEIYEDNALGNCQVIVEWEDTEGKKTILKEPSWTDGEGMKKAEMNLKEDGIYRMKVLAEDLAGYSETKEAQVIIDSHDPVIRYVDELEGRYMKKFQWNYQKDAFIQDFTTYMYQIQLDGRLYAVGEEVEEEGRHILKVQATDSAGNRAEAKARFVVDHTPPEILFLDVEDSGVYEEEKDFRIISEDSEDEIQEIWINGVLQNISKQNKEHQFTVQDKKSYEVIVKARDRAGNEGVSSIMFEVIPRETIFQKALKPVRQIFIKEETKGKVKGKMKEESNGKKEIPVVPVSAAVCSVCAAGGIWCKKKKVVQILLGWRDNCSRM